MKGLLIFKNYIDSEYDLGVNKKILSQIKSFQKKFNSIDFIYLKKDGAYLNDIKLYPIRNNKFHRFYFFHILFYTRLVKKIINKNSYDFLYLRRSITSNFVINSLKRFRYKNRNASIIMEIPTYPYRHEAAGFLDNLLHFWESLFDKKMATYVNSIITFCNQPTIFKIPTIQLENGAQDPYSEKEINVEQRKDRSDQLHLISVSGLTKWHAVDRIIAGINNYYHNLKNEKIKVYLHLVGGSKEAIIVHENMLSLEAKKYVTFYGILTGEKLDNLYQFCDIGIDALGCHRKNVFISSSLKNREYCFNGKPIIISTKDNDFPHTLPFVHYIKEDESSIDIPSIILFYTELKNTIPNYRTLIRNYALTHLTWDIKLQAVFEKIVSSAKHD